MKHIISAQGPIIILDGKRRKERRTEWKKKGRKATHRNLRRLKNIFWHMPRTQLPPNLRLNIINQTLRKLLTRLHQQKQHHTLILILRPPLPYTNALTNLREFILNSRIYLR